MADFVWRVPLSLLRSGFKFAVKMPGKPLDRFSICMICMRKNLCHTCAFRLCLKISRQRTFKTMLPASSRLLIATFVLILSQLGTASINNLAAQAVKIEGPEDTSSWAFHDSGRIFAAVKSTNSVVEYDTQGKKVRSFDVDADPTEMIIKGDRLVVACNKTSSFSVIDLSTNAVAGKVALAGQGPRALCCSKVDNGIVYGFCRNGSSSRDTELFQVDVKSLKILNRQPARSWRRSPYNAAMSTDGQWVVVDPRGSGSSGASLMQVDEASCTFTQIKDVSSSFGQILAGPASRYWTFGGSLYPLDLKAKEREFAGNPAAIHSQLDLAVSFSKDELKFLRFSDAKIVKKVPLSFVKKSDEKDTKKKSRSSRNRKFPYENVMIGFGAKSPSVVVASGSICQVMDLKKLAIPFEPMLMMNIPTSVEASVTEGVSVPLSVTNRSLNRKVVYEIKSGPKGALIAGNKLVWKTTPENIGRHTVVVAAKAGGKVDEVSVNLDVKSKKIELDFRVVGINVEDTGKFAVVWGKKIPKGQQGFRGGFPGDNSQGGDEVAVVDLLTSKVLVQKTLAAGVKSAAIQGKYVFLMPRTGNVLYRLDVKTLEGSKRVFLKEAGLAVFAFPGNQIAYTLGSHNRTLTVVDPETLKTVQTKTIPYTGSNNKEVATLVAPGAVSLGSKIVSQDDDSLMMLKQNPGLPLLGKFDARGNYNSSHSMRDMSEKMFGRHVGYNKIASSSGSTVSQVQKRRMYPCSVYHVAFGVGTDTKQVGRSTETNLTLDTYSLVDGEVLDSRIFDSSMQRNGGSPFGFGNSGSKQFFTFKDKAVYASNNQVFVIPFDTKMLESAPQPLYFPVSKLPMLSIDAPQTIDLKAVGGKGKLEYQLVAEFPGISVDSKTGSGQD